MRLLFITQKIDEQDDDLAFSTQWIDAFANYGYEVSALCLQKGDFDNRFPVYSLGKEKGYSKPRMLWRLVRYVVFHKYDRVFVHMNPEYATYVGWWWWLTDTRVYFWYTHYTNYFHVRIMSRLARRMFAATKQSLPQYELSPKKVVTGHGVNVKYWSSDGLGGADNEKKLLMVHRIARAKRVELGIRALSLLPQDYTLTIYGRPIQPDYFEELKTLVEELGLSNRVDFKGPVPMPDLRSVYPQYRLMINQAFDTIDKTMLECMVAGVFPITTRQNSRDIGLDIYPDGDTPEAIAAFIRHQDWKKISPRELRQIVSDKHDLRSLVEKMSTYIKPGI